MVRNVSKPTNLGRDSARLDIWTDTTAEPSRISTEISKPTYFGNDHVLNSKLVSETCEQFCICYKLYPKHDKKFHRTQF